jgi:hypothetical protein
MIGSCITTETGLADLWQHAVTHGGSYPAVLAGNGTVWTIFKDNRGNDWAYSVPSTEPDSISTLKWRTLTTDNPAGLIVLWHGGPLDQSQRTVPYDAAYAVLETIREHGRGAITAPVHQAFVTAGILLEQLLGEPASAPPYTLIGANRG